MRQRGYKASTKMLFSSLVAVSEEVAAKLEIDPGDELACLERLRLADGVPLSIEVSNLVHRYCPGILKGDYVGNSLREALERDYDTRLARAEQVIRAITATPDLAKKLSIPPHSALLYIERVSYSPMNVPIEFLRLYHWGDRYALYNELFD